jgi:hypothetical protein
MAPHTRIELVAEIVELQREQLESFTDGTFIGWPPEHQAAHQKRGYCLARLVLELEALDETSKISGSLADIVPFNLGCYRTQLLR